MGRCICEELRFVPLSLFSLMPRGGGRRGLFPSLQVIFFPLFSLYHACLWLPCYFHNPCRLSGRGPVLVFALINSLIGARAFSYRTSLEKERQRKGEKNVGKPVRKKQDPKKESLFQRAPCSELQWTGVIFPTRNHHHWTPAQKPVNFHLQCLSAASKKLCHARAECS